MHASRRTSLCRDAFWFTCRRSSISAFRERSSRPSERSRLRTLIQRIRQDETIPSGGFIVRTAGIGISEDDLRQDARYLVRTWQDIRKSTEKAKSPALVHQDLDLVQRLLRDHLSDEFTAIRVDSEEEYLRTVEFINRMQPKMVNRVKLYTREDPILEAYGVQEEIDKALKPRVWLRSGGYLVINQTEALVAIDVNTGKFVGKGNARLEDTITRTNMEAVDEIARQIRLRDLGGIIVLDLIDMEDRRNRHKVSQALQEALQDDKSPTKVLSFNDFGLIIMTRKRVKQSLERTMCAPCDYCEGAGWVKSPTTVCYEILSEARRLSQAARRCPPDNAADPPGRGEIAAQHGTLRPRRDRSLPRQRRPDRRPARSTRHSSTSRSSKREIRFEKRKAGEYMLSGLSFFEISETLKLQRTRTQVLGRVRL